jgi:hypothetical protein
MCTPITDSKWYLNVKVINLECPTNAWIIVWNILDIRLIFVIIFCNFLNIQTIILCRIYNFSVKLDPYACCCFNVEMEEVSKAYDHIHSRTYYGRASLSQRSVADVLPPPHGWEETATTPGTQQTTVTMTTPGNMPYIGYHDNTWKHAIYRLPWQHLETCHR